MTFQAPLLLLLLVAVPLVAVLYAFMQRRRRKFAVTFTNVDLLAAVAGRSYTRHVPAVFALLALAALLVALARPERTVDAERREANVLLVFDTSGSMLATDVQPTRLAAAQLAGMTFTDAVPDEFRIGVIGFGSSAQQLTEPTTDHAAREGDDPEPPGRGRDRDGRRAQARVQLRARARCRTASAAPAGSRARSSCSATARAPAATTRSTSSRTPRSSRSRSTPSRSARQNGTLTHTDPNTGATNTERVPPDLLTLQDIARDTGGQFFATADANRLAGRVPQHRHAADEDQGEAAGDVGLRGRRARAAADRRRLRPRAGSAAPMRTR